MTRTYLRFLSGAAVVATGLAIGAFGASPLRVQAQAPEPLPRFEVASIKENVSGPGRMSATTPGGGRLVITNNPLKILIAEAYLGPQPFVMSRVLGGPEWVESARWDINAKASAPFQPSPAGPPREMLLMIRSLLEERFKLVTHRETRQMPIYELVLVKPDGTLGPGLRTSPNDCDAIMAAVRAGGPRPQPAPGEPPPCGAMRGPAGVLAGGVEMAQFASMLSLALADAGGGGREQGRLVVDKTGLTGRFAFGLRWTPIVMPTATPPPGLPPIDPNGPSLFIALEEQLGLRLQPATAPLEVVVIDSIERPTPD
jgi:uncharacterized protein (TIGR03435 family)